MPDHYPTPQYRRTALAPGILAALVLLAGIALVGQDSHTVILFAVSILAAIIIVFAWQAKQWFWIVPLGLVVIAFNPVVPIDYQPDVLLALHYIAVLVFVAAAIFIKTRNTEDRNKR